MTESANRTFICSVVFFDIVEYSKKSVSEQISLKNRFNALLSEALQDVSSNDRVILDTGDGAAISFLGDLKDALFVAMHFRDALAATTEPVITPALLVRTGVNLGPVKLVKDINGQPNIIGDGINAAQRIMSFANINQVLVSRPYYDGVARLSEDYNQLFSYVGICMDKQVREHEVFAVGTTGVDIRTRKIVHHQSAADMPSTGAADGSIAAGADIRKKLLIWAPLALSMILLVGFLMRGQRSIPAVPVTATAKQIPARSTPLAQASTEKAPKPLSAKSGYLGLSVVPWGEVYVDGKLQGISPPLKFVEIEPGSHKIEIKNTTFPSHIEMVFIQPGKRVKIKHKFNE